MLGESARIDRHRIKSQDLKMTENITGNIGGMTSLELRKLAVSDAYAVGDSFFLCVAGAVSVTDDMLCADAGLPENGFVMCVRNAGTGTTYMVSDDIPQRVNLTVSGLFLKKDIVFSKRTTAVRSSSLRRSFSRMSCFGCGCFQRL